MQPKSNYQFISIQIKKNIYVYINNNEKYIYSCSQVEHGQFLVSRENKLAIKFVCQKNTKLLFYCLPHVCVSKQQTEAEAGGGGFSISFSDWLVLPCLYIYIYMTCSLAGVSTPTAVEVNYLTYSPPVTSVLTASPYHSVHFCY